MIERVYNSAQIAERYGVSRDTALKYMRQMRHMENPVMVTESALLEWEASRTVDPNAPKMAKSRKKRMFTPMPISADERYIIPRRRA